MNIYEFIDNSSITSLKTLLILSFTILRVGVTTPVSGSSGDGRIRKSTTSPSGGSARLAASEPRDFKRFKIVLRGVTASTAPGLQGLQFDDDGHAWVAQSAIFELMGESADEVWIANYGRMHEFAAHHGWVNAEGALRGHVEMI